MRDVKVFTLNDMTFLEYNDVIEKWPSTFSRVFEKAKSYCCGALYPYEVGSLGHSDVWLEISHWLLQEKSRVILRLDMQIEKSNYFSGDKKHLE